MKRKRAPGTRRSRLQPLHVRRMHAADLPQVVHIEAHSYPSPWTEEYFRHCLQAGFCCQVLAHDGVIEAYGIMSVDPGAALIVNLCVRPASRRRGLGRTMLSHLLTLAREHQAQTVQLHVRASNLPAIRLYESMGFQHVGSEPGYYHLPQGHEDAFVMARRL